MPREWLTIRCGGCAEGEICNEAAMCEVVSRPSAAVVGVDLRRLGAPEDGVFQYEIEYQLIVFDPDGNSVEPATVEPRGFTQEGFELAFGPANACEVTRVSADARTVSVPMVLDQSGSITGTDPDDLRVPAAKEFLQSLGPDDESALISFASGNACSEFAVSLYNGGFTSDHTSFFGVLDSLVGCEGGGTPLYDACVAATRLVSEEGSKEAKAIVLFTDGDDTASSARESDVISAATQAGVKIFTIGLSEGVNHQVLANIAQRTGGAYFFAIDIGPAVSAFRGMNLLLTGDYHRIDCRNGLTVTVPVDQQPGTALTNIGVDVGGYRTYAPLFMNLQGARQE